MRIWIINHYAIPPASSGGTRHYNLAQQLQNKGHEVLLIAANFNHFSHSFIEAKDQVDHGFEVPFLWIPVTPYKGNTAARFLNMLSFPRALLKSQYIKNAAPPDIIIGSSPHLFAAWGAMRLAKRLQRPFVLEIRDLWPESLVELGRFTHKHPLIRVMKYIERKLYRNAQKVLTLLPSAHEYFKAHGVDEQNIVWLPNFIDALKVPSELVRVPGAKFTVMHAGAHGLANDLETVVLAGKILEEQGYGEKIRIVLVGEGPEKAALKALAALHQLSIVEFLDPVPKAEVYATLNQADAYLMLLKKSPVFRWGISPNKLFDYLVMARPVIFGVEVPFNPIAEAQAGLSIPPSDPEALAEAIIEMAGLSKAERDAMGARGKAYVTEHHEVRALGSKLEALMLEVKG